MCVQDPTGQEPREVVSVIGPSSNFSSVGPGAFQMI